MPAFEEQGSYLSSFEEDLVCPSCKSTLENIAAERLLSCTGCDQRYPLVNGIAIMLVK
jgi:uncharacterized protein YbaR (Trm112 family)